MDASNKPPRKTLPCECGCPPGSHEKVSGEGGSEDVVNSKGSLPTTLANKLAGVSFSASCLLCSNEVHFDVNTGIEFKYCEDHLDNATKVGSDSDSDEEYSTANGGIDIHIPHTASSPPILQVNSVPSQATATGIATCAIEDCSKPRHVDANGIVHECCGYTHAMELIRRKTLERKLT